MYYTNIKDYERLLTKNEEVSTKPYIVITIMLCAVSISFIFSML